MKKNSSQEDAIAEIDELLKTMTPYELVDVITGRIKLVNDPASVTLYKAQLRYLIQWSFERARTMENEIRINTIDLVIAMVKKPLKDEKKSLEELSHEDIQVHWGSLLRYLGELRTVIKDDKLEEFLKKELSLIEKRKEQTG